MDETVQTKLGNQQIKASLFSRWRTPLGLSLALFLTTFNIVVLQISMPALVEEYQTTVSFIQAALVILSLVTMAFIPTNDNLGRRLGRKRVLNYGLIGHAVGMFLCASSLDMIAFGLSYVFLLGIATTSLLTVPWTFLNERYAQPQRQRVQIMLTLGVSLGVALAA